MRFLAWAIVVVLIAATVLIARGAEMPAVVLVDHVVVNHARITLADLLPGTASPTLQVRAAQFDLGRAPQVGAARVLEREWLQARLSESEFSGLALPPRIVVERASWNDAARERVKAAVRNHLNAKIGSRAAGSADFLWPASVPHLKPDASLNVVSDEWDKRTHALQLRIACSARRDCLPFYVTLRFAGSLADLRQIGGKFAHPREFSSPVQRAESERTAPVPRLSRKKPAPVLTQPGTLASMTVETRGIHIFTQVMCLERGVEGQIIRVRNPDSKRILRAQVVGPGRVRGPV